MSKKKENQKDARIDLPSLGRIYARFRLDYARHWKAIAVSYSGLLLLVGVTLLLPWPLKLILDHIVLGRHLPHQAAFLDRWSGSTEMLLGALVVGYVLLREWSSIPGLVDVVRLLPRMFAWRRHVLGRRRRTSAELARWFRQAGG